MPSKEGFLIDEDELARLKVQNWRARFNTDSLTLTIIPTLDCNLNCSYCNHKRKEPGMTSEIEKSLLDFVEEMVPKVEYFSVFWKGGEPLLSLDTITRLNKEFRRISHSSDSRFSASISTNGFILTPKVAQDLREAGISGAEITLDGPRSIHDKRRPLENGGGTFDKILTAITDCVDIFEQITIRINIDQGNRDSLDELLSILEQRGLKERTKLDPVEVLTHCSLCSLMAPNCFSPVEFNSIETDFYHELLGRGFRLRNDPLPRSHYCHAQTINALVVDPCGYLYQCDEEIRDSGNAIGHLKETLQSDNSLKWLAWDPFESEDCRRCDMLSICMGGCPYLAIKEGHSTHSTRCDQWRSNLQTRLELFSSAVPTR